LARGESRFWDQRRFGFGFGLGLGFGRKTSIRLLLVSSSRRSRGEHAPRPPPVTRALDGRSRRDTRPDHSVRK
jgi:hypothetical protein